MLLREISLKNIRSYDNENETTIRFPDGIVLFEGDVGSGKSTILYAVEFALFGLAEVNGKHLLNDRKQSGHVRLRFSVEGKDWEVRRGLVRKKDSVAQEECYIEEDGKRTKMSPADLKERVIEVMRFNELSNPRAGSLVYRFAVFTPQEQMKNIIQKDSEERFKVLRRVLGILDYQVATENSELVEQRIKGDVYALKKASADFEEKKKDADSLSSEITQLEIRIPALERARLSAIETLDNLASQSKELISLKESVSNMVSKAPDLEKSVKMLTSASKGATEKANRSKKRLDEDYLPFIEEFQKRKPPGEKTADAIEHELEERRKQRQEKVSGIRVLQSQAKQVHELLAADKCPRCGQKINETDFEGKVDHMKAEVEATEAELKTIDGEVRELAALQKLTASYEEDSKRFATSSKEKVNLERDIVEAQAEALKFQEQLEQSKQELEAAKREEGNLKDVVAKIEEIEVKLAEARRKWETASGELTQAVEQKKAKSESLDKLGAEIEKMKAMREEAQKLGGYQSWLSDYFRPAVGQIEENILDQLNGRFNHHFRRLFSSMVDDSDLGVRVTKDFSPVLERQGFEQEYETLSGGERTSVALAYRLALNAIVQETANSSVGELVILDEPTEGFSKEQVYKMRDILKELGSKQVVIVSHERELEAMAQHIFQVQKVNGTSTVATA